MRKLKFIKRSKELGFTLKEIKELLNLKIESTATCGDVKHLAEHKLNDIEERINDLKNIKSVLRTDQSMYMRRSFIRRMPDS